MPAKRSIYVEDIGEIHIYKKKRMTSIRLRVDHEGHVVLSVPRWIMLRQAINFAKTKKDWIIGERSKTGVKIEDGVLLGGGIRLVLTTTNSSRPTSRFAGNELKISVPKSYSEEKSHRFIKKKIQDALRSRAEEAILPRLRMLAELNGIKYRSASVATLKSRWGSCDNKGNIKLSAYLLQLPGELIDYVLLHELNHVKHMNHSRIFWSDLKNMCQDADNHRKAIKDHSPRLKTFLP